MAATLVSLVKEIIILMGLPGKVKVKKCKIILLKNYNLSAP